jgi:hypothetical protein
MAKKGVAKSKLKPSAAITDGSHRTEIHSVGIIGDKSPQVVLDATFPELDKEKSFKITTNKFTIDFKITRNVKK